MAASTACKEISSLLEEYYTLGRTLDDYFIQYFKEHVIPQDIEDKLRRLNEKYSLQQLTQEEEISSFQLQLQKIARKKNFLDWKSYREFIQRENFITCSLFRILQIHRTIIMLMKDQNILDIEVLSRVGIELISKVYMVTQSNTFYKVLDYHDDRKIKKGPGNFPEKGYFALLEENGTENKRNIKKNLANELSSDNFYKDNNLKIDDIIGKTEKTSRDFFYKKIFSVEGFSQAQPANQSNFIHSNPDGLCNSFSDWQIFFFLFNDPSGEKKFEKLSLNRILIWLLFLDEIFHDIYSYFKLDNKDLKEIRSKFRQIVHIKER